MTGIDDQGRRHPPSAAGEVETVVGFLEFQRATFAWRCRGVDAAGLTVTVGTSAMTLGGLLKHLALVEDWWFGEWLAGTPTSPPFDAIDWDADPDWDWRTAADDGPDGLWALWEASVERSRAQVARALADGGMDTVAVRVGDDGRSPTLRWILLHMVEEYARHIGHADLLREAVDGSTGE